MLDDGPDICHMADLQQFRDSVFKAAYYTIERSKLWRIMDQHGFPEKLIRLIRGNDERFVAQCTNIGRQQGDVMRKVGISSSVTVETYAQPPETRPFLEDQN